MPKEKDWGGILSKIETPLVFFALFILVLSAALPIVLGFTEFGKVGDARVVAGYAALMIATLVTVAVMAYKKPSGLWREVSEMKQFVEFLESSAFEDYVSNVVHKNVKPEAPGRRLDPEIRAIREEERNDG